MSTFRGDGRVITVPDDLGDLKRAMSKISGKSANKRLPSQREPDTSMSRLNQRAARKRSKTKGDNFERKVAKMFAAWSGMEVRRTPQSGGWGSTSFGVSGDLVVNSKRFPFHVECKNREDWQLDDLITGVRTKDERSILEWWRQTVNTCPKSKEPLLIFKRNGKQVLVVVRASYTTRVGRSKRTDDGLRDYRVALSKVPQMMTTLRDVPGGDTIVNIMRLDAFLAVEPPPKRKEKR